MSTRFTASLVLIIVSLAQVACSFVSPFVIVNESREPIQVRYTFKRNKFAYPQETAPFLFHTPSFIAVDDLKQGRMQFVEAQAPDFSYDETTGVVDLTLRPGLAVCLQHLSNYSRHVGASPDRFDISAIQIIGTEGTISLTGDSARVQFASEPRSVFAIRYW